MIRIALAQMNLHVGAIEKNTDQIIAWAQKAVEQKSDCILFPELSITSYPPEDLLMRPSLYERVDNALEKIRHAKLPITMIVGFPEKTKAGVYNAAAVIQHGKHIATYRKQALPNYDVFDEKRYFQAGNTPCLFELHGKKLAVTICEDAWKKEPIAKACEKGADAILCLNASPFDRDKAKERTNVIMTRAKDNHVSILYANLVGGQDEIVFDGGSFVTNSQGEITQLAPFFTESLMQVTLDKQAEPTPEKCDTTQKEIKNIYDALVLGTRDYIEKNGFANAFIGLSGGIASALMLAIATDAIGSDRVTAVMMPSRYTASMSLEDAQQEAQALGVHYHVVEIEPIFNSFLHGLSPLFRDLEKNTTEENLQARIRGTLLMALSNKFHGIVLTTGNRSEMAVGYATLYGDMAGGFAAIKNIPKMMVYELAHYRNALSPVIPQRVIERAPSAELSEDQKDEDSLPPYPILDQILALYIEADLDAADIINQGFDADTVNRIVRLVNRNEYKRRQAPPGVRISHRAFGKDRRYPITSGYLN